MKTRRTTDRTATRMTDTGIRGVCTNIVSLRRTEDEATKRMGPERVQPVQTAMLSHERIAERARAIWEERGCLPDRDEENWRDAEAQLKTELGMG